MTTPISQHFTLEEMTAACERDNFMTAEEAKEFGLIDKVIYKR